MCKILYLFDTGLDLHWQLTSDEVELNKNKLQREMYHDYDYVKLKVNITMYSHVHDFQCLAFCYVVSCHVIHVTSILYLAQ